MPRVHFVRDQKLAKAIPRDIAIDMKEEKMKKIRELRESKLSPFQGKNMVDVWKFSLSLGYRSDEREALSSPARRIPVSAISATDLAAVISIAIERFGNIDFLITKEAEEIFSIAEEYANAGLDELYYTVFGDVQKDPIDKLVQKALQK